MKKLCRFFKKIDLKWLYAIFLLIIIVILTSYFTSIVRGIIEFKNEMQPVEIEVLEIHKDTETEKEEGLVPVSLQLEFLDQIFLIDAKLTSSEVIYFEKKNKFDSKLSFLLFQKNRLDNLFLYINGRIVHEIEIDFPMSQHLRQEWNKRKDEKL